MKEGYPNNRVLSLYSLWMDYTSLYIVSKRNIQDSFEGFANTLHPC
ncbi:unnamed protein product [Linum tenue]|uniref:Uncharacterized protein n=1 Tax=Linum tenue TaxID=586396 RepID=A0AAV0NWL9_9ROSI|nr:unnamed protein product [Linum tenue]